MKNIFKHAVIALFIVIVFGALGFRFIYDRPPMASVFPEKMNVFYIGVDNPISVAAAGVPPSNFQIEFRGGGIMCRPAGPGRYTVLASAGTETSMTVYDITDTANRIQQGTFKFRIKKNPNPETTFAGHFVDDSLAKSDFITNNGVIARMSGFDFDCMFNMVSYTVTVIENGKVDEYPVSGPAFSAEIKDRFAVLKTGARVEFRNVKVHGPDGTIRKIPGLSFIVK